MTTASARTLLILAAQATGDALSMAGADADTVAFAIVLWPVGDPERCGSICGCGSTEAVEELPIALASASLKTTDEPNHIAVHNSRKGRPC